MLFMLWFIVKNWKCKFARRPSRGIKPLLLFLKKLKNLSLYFYFNYSIIYVMEQTTMTYFHRIALEEVLEKDIFFD